jgi:hypothetical protein
MVDFKIDFITIFIYWGKVGGGLKSVFTKEFYVSNEQINKILSGGSIMGK